MSVCMYPSFCRSVKPVNKYLYESCTALLPPFARAVLFFTVQGETVNDTTRLCARASSHTHTTVTNYALYVFQLMTGETDAAVVITIDMRCLNTFASFLCRHFISYDRTRDWWLKSGPCEKKTFSPGPSLNLAPVLKNLEI